MKKRDRISAVMTVDPITLKPDDNMFQVDKVFKQENIHHIPICENEQVVGMISKSDYLLFKRGYDDDTTDARLDLFRLRKWKIAEVMSKDVKSIDKDSSIEQASDMLLKNLYHSVIVTDNKKMVGIVTTHDLLSHAMSNKKTK